jgi:hypothetical protein
MIRSFTVSNIIWILEPGFSTEDLPNSCEISIIGNTVSYVKDAIDCASNWYRYKIESATVTEIQPTEE